MNLAKSKATTMAAVVLITGVAAGGILAMATPTRMSHEGESWRDMIGVRKVAVEDSGIPIYTPPQDLTPVSWQTAAQEYPAVPTQADQGIEDHWADVSNDVMPDVIPDSDDSYQPAAVNEALPDEIMQSRAAKPDLARLDDAAAASADAARAAAADVRKQENAAVGPAASDTAAESVDATAT